MLEIEIRQIAPGRYRAALDGRVLVESRRMPLLDAARVLAAEGFDPAITLGMRRATGPIAMTGRIDALAGLTVRDNDRGPRFEPYRSHPGEMPIAEPPVSRQRPSAKNPTQTSPGRRSPVLDSTT